MKDFSDVLSQAKKVQEKMKEAQENLRKIEVEGVAGGETVKIILNGDYELKNIKINESLLKEKKEILEDLIIAAHSDAKQKLKSKTSEEIEKITSGIGLPPGFKLPF